MTIIVVTLPMRKSRLREEVAELRFRLGSI